MIHNHHHLIPTTDQKQENVFLYERWCPMKVKLSSGTWVLPGTWPVTCVKIQRGEPRAKLLMSVSNKDWTSGPFPPSLPGTWLVSAAMLTLQVYSYHRGWNGHTLKEPEILRFYTLNLSNNPEQMNLFLYSGEKTRYFHLSWQRLGGVWMNDAERRKWGLMNLLRKWILKETPNIRIISCFVFVFMTFICLLLHEANGTVILMKGGLLPCQASTKMRCFIMTDLRGHGIYLRAAFLKCSRLPMAFKKSLSSPSPTPFLE